MEDALAVRPQDEHSRLPHDFRSLPKAQQRRLLLELIEQGHSDEQIGGMLGLSQWQVRNLRYRLGIKKDRGGNVHLEPAEESAHLRLAPSGTAAAAAAMESHLSFSLTLCGTYRADQLARRLEGLRALFEAAGPEKAFHVRIQVTEAAVEPMARASVEGASAGEKLG